MNTYQTTDSQTPSRRELIAEQAANWLVCFRTHQFSQDDPYRDPVVRDAAFIEWIKQSSAHLLLFMEMVEIERRFNRLDVSELGQIRSLLRERKGEATRASPAKEGLLPGGANEPSFGTPRSQPMRLIGLAAALCVAAVALTYFSQSHAEVYSTPSGQHRDVVLKDGSSVKLNTDSRIEVTLSGTARLVKLVRGEAYFNVKPDKDHPFTVTAGGARIQDIGTAFNVRLREQSVSVAVTDGKVKVDAVVSPDPGRSMTLVAGRTAEVTGNTVVELSGTDAKDSTAWLQGMLIFDKRRLEEAVAEFNRYSPGQIVIEGTGVQDVLVSGMFKADRCEDFVAYVRGLRGVAVDAEEGHWVVRTKD